MGVARIGDRVFVVGGWGGSGFRKSRSDLFSVKVTGGGLSALAGRNWESRAPMRQPRRDFACVAHDKSLYVFGGNDDGNFGKVKRLDTVEQYDTETDQWITSLPEMPGGPRSGCAAGVVGNKIYVVGGEDKDGNALASTIVFDASSLTWDSSATSVDASDGRNTPIALPAEMKIERYGLSVVVVDHFIVAIGGYGGDSGSSSIEVLDTQHNSWQMAKLRMNSERDFLAAGAWKESDKNKIIVAGGGREAETIDFDDGLLLPVYALTERGQVNVLQGDTDRGPDRLGVKFIAIALVEMLAFKDLVPPMALGILGRWGRGKSFFFNLMLDHIIKIQKCPIDRLVREAYVGHIYVIKFDAWAFSKGDIWSSLMYEILKGLNEQLQFEERVGKEKLIYGLVSTVEVFRNLSASEIQYMKDNPKVLKDYEEIKKKSDSASSCLLNAINRNYDDDKKELEYIKTEIEKARSDMKECKAFIKTRDALNIIGRMALGWICKNDKASADTLMMIKYIFGFRISNIPPYAIVSCVAIIILAVFIHTEDYGSKALTTTSAILAGAIPYIASTFKTIQQLDPILRELNEDLEEGVYDNEDLRKLRYNETEIRNRAIAFEGVSLRDTVSKMNAGAYVKNLGIVHQVQEDLRQISDSMRNPRKQGIFPRGEPRVFLFVDDLDRCPHEEVVEVIEALQLLVTTKLFIAVVAIDPLYVTLSLEKHYKGILNKNSRTTGMDYLEKIIQIPIRLPGMGTDKYGGFLEQEIQAEESEEPNRPRSLDSEPSAYTVPSTTDNVGVIEENTIDLNTATVNPDDDDLPSYKILFTKEEKNMMIEISELVEVGPRCMRRIANVSKLLQVIFRRDLRISQDFHLRRATIFLMLLASNESTRAVTYKIFDWMDLGTVKYHRVMQDDVGEKIKKNNLAYLFKMLMYQEDKNFTLENEDGFPEKDTLMDHINEYLAEYKWESIEDWDKIASKFLLARCFSFFHLPDEEMLR